MSTCSYVYECERKMESCIIITYRSIRNKKSMKNITHQCRKRFVIAICNIILFVLHLLLKLHLQLLHLILIE